MLLRGTSKTSSIYLYVKLKALASWIFLSFTSFWRNSDSYEYKNLSARKGAQFVPIGMPTTCWNRAPPELEVKETTDTASSALFLDLCLEFDDSGQLSTKIYDKRDDFNFKIINFPNMCCNIPASPAYNILDIFLLLYLYTFSLYENASLIIFCAETEYISTRYWYRNINFLRDRIRRIF
jgi:hypothetical protein